MKAAINGVIQLSILDGWWDEAFNGENGWAIGSGEEYGEDHANQDLVESMMLYDILENEVIPLYYERGLDKLPHNWIKKMKNSIHSIIPFFNTHRMVREYTEKFYLPVSENLKTLSDKNCEVLKNLVSWKKYIHDNWDQVEIKSVISNKKSEVYIGDPVEILAQIYLGSINENDVFVELYYGEVDHEVKIINGKTLTMEFVKKDKGNVATFKTNILTTSSGAFGYIVRVLPKHEGFLNKYIEGLIKIG
jgi:starch phosphorylase